MYFSALPGYQGVPLSQLRFSRVLFGGFPSFAASPLKPAFDRVLQASRTLYPEHFQKPRRTHYKAMQHASAWPWRSKLRLAAQETCNCRNRAMAMVCGLKTSSVLAAYNSRFIGLASYPCILKLSVYRHIVELRELSVYWAIGETRKENLVHRWATPAPVRAPSASAASAAWSGTCRA